MMSTLEVSRQRLVANVRAIRTVLLRQKEGTVASAGTNGPELLGVVKANAYGHSAQLVAPMLVDAGVRWLGVTDAEEGVAVRESLAWSQAEILLMLGPPGDTEEARRDADLAVRHRLTPVIWTARQMKALAEAASESAPISIHVEVDTGMSRQGTQPGRALDELLKAVREEPRVRLDGVLTHLATAEAADGRQTHSQMRTFAEAIRTIRKTGLQPEWVHVGNASTIDNGSVEVIEELTRLAEDAGARALVRCGLGLYGLCLPMEGSGESRLRGLLRPVLTWRTNVVSVQAVAEGASIGYGASFTATRRMHVALLPVGYADGLRRCLSGTDIAPGGWVMIRGRRAAIVGRISMNLTTVDVTGFDPAIEPGERVVLLGDGVTAEDHAAICGVLPYEVLCGLRGKAVVE